MSRPRPVNTPPPAKASATGMRKRRVDPDSPQSSRGSSSPVEVRGVTPPTPRTRRTLPSRVQAAPRASMHRRVARMSSLRATFSMTLSPAARAAAMRRR